MLFYTPKSIQRQRRYPFLAAFDFTLNFVLSCGVFALGCGLLGLILASNAPRLLEQFSLVMGHVLS